MNQDTFLLFRDRGRGWCAAPPLFRNILSHPIGHGKTQAEAVHDLLGHPEFIHRARSGEWPLYPDMMAFVELASDKSFFAIPKPKCRRGGLNPATLARNLNVQEARA